MKTRYTPNAFAIAAALAVIVKKTFAWGGIYGSSTSIEDVEQGFADGVANGVMGRAN